MTGFQLGAVLLAPTHEKDSAMSYRIGSRKTATPTHEKSMGSYELFAWRDALAMASWLDQEYGAAHARRVFNQFDTATVVAFERKCHELIADFIQKSEAQRPAYLRRVSKDSNDTTRILFVTLAIIGVLRTKAVMEIRDNFRTVLAPGRGNRVTTASIYDFAEGVRDLFRYDWPREVFDALCINDIDFDEE